MSGSWWGGRHAGEGLRNCDLACGATGEPGHGIGWRFVAEFGEGGGGGWFGSLHDAENPNPPVKPAPFSRASAACRETMWRDLGPVAERAEV